MSKSVILCVDDETIVLDSLKIQLKQAFGDKYVYEVAESAAEALEVIEEFSEQQTSEVLVIISDWLMPGMKGDELLVKVHKKFPTIIKLMLTGQADKEAVEHAFQEANLTRCLYKPWNAQELIETIKRELTGV